MKHYAALLRGINLGNRRVKMEALRAMFEQMGFTNVRTLQASGNVVFASKTSEPAKLARAIERQVVETFGFDSDTFVSSAEEIAKLVKLDPFAKEKLKEGSRTHISFLGQPLDTKSPFPYKAPDGSFRIVAITKTHLACIVEPTSSTLSYMDYLGKLFGAQATTRTWNTVLKLHEMLSEG